MNSDFDKLSIKQQKHLTHVQKTLWSAKKLSERYPKRLEILEITTTHIADLLRDILAHVDEDILPRGNIYITYLIAIMDLTIEGKENEH